MNPKVNINVKFSDVNSNSDFKSASSTMCNSEVMGLSTSTKTGSKDVNSPSSGLALRNLGKSVDSEDDEEDDLERLLNENGEQDNDEYQLIRNPCNGFIHANTSEVSKQLSGKPNAALNMQG